MQAQVTAWRFVSSSERLHRLVFLTALLLCVAAATFSLYIAFGKALGDSQDNNWGPAQALLQGLNPYKLYLDCTACSKPPFNPPVSPMYPASGLMFLWPLAMLPWPMAKFVWAVLNVVLGAALCMILVRLFLPKHGWRTPVVVGCALFAGTPFLNNLGNGQHAIFALAFFAAALWADRKGSPALCGALLAVSWLKYTITFPLSLIFVVRGRFAPLLGAIAIHLALTFFAAAWTGDNPVDLLLGPVRVARDVASVGHLELFGLATRLGLTSKLPPLVAACAMTLAVLTAIFRKRSEDELSLLTLLALFGYAVIYHYPYDLVMLVFPLVYVISRIELWHGLCLLEKIWASALLGLVGWISFADHIIQILKRSQVMWVVAFYPAYYLTLAAWFYATICIGIVLVGWRSPDPQAESLHLRHRPLGFSLKTSTRR